MTSTAIKEYDSVKVCHLDLLKTSYDEWKVDFYNLIGASTPSLYYLLSSPDGLLRNRPSTFVDADAPTEAEKEALRVYDTRQLQLFSRLMMCLPKQLMLVAQQGQPMDGDGGMGMAGGMGSGSMLPGDTPPAFGEPPVAAGDTGASPDAVGGDTALPDPG